MTIPDDVMMAAQLAFNRIDPEGASSFADPISPIARAIMAERERCAKKADASAEEAEGFATTVSLRSTSLEFLACADREMAIAAAIRKGEA